jgi:CheY-like chemotaxis protein
MITIRATVTSPARILIVEDDPALRATMSDLLEDEGYEVECAANGAEALARLDASAAPGLILLDLAMPVMDGWSFRAAQRRDARLAAIPTIVVSASFEPGRGAVEDLAAEAFLPKPFDLDQLMRTVHRVCERPGGRATPRRQAQAALASRR